MFRLFFPLLVMGLVIVSIFLVFRAIVDGFETTAQRVPQPHQKEGSNGEKQRVANRAALDAITDKYDNKYSGSLEAVYKNAYIKKRSEVIEEYVREDVRSTLENQEQKTDTSDSRSSSRPTIGKTLTAPAEVELYQKRFIELMAEKEKFSSPYEDREYQIIEKEKFFKGFS